MKPVTVLVSVRRSRRCYFTRFKMYEISKETKRKVYEMFDRNEKSVEEDVEIVKAWMRTQPHFPEIMEDVKIRNFLNLNKFSIEKTKQKIDNYYTIRGLMPEIFAQSNPKLDKLQSFLDKTYYTIHPKSLDGLHKIWFVKPKSPNTFSYEASVILTFCIFEMRLYEDFIVDDIFVFDMAHLTLNDMKTVTPGLVGKALTIYQKVYSLRINSICFINSPPYVTMFMSILKAILKPKIFDRVTAHQDTQVLKELLPKEDLPKDYGGDGPSLDELNEMIRRQLAKYQNRFDVLDTLKVDESLRPEKLDNDEFLGYYGNFKKINFD